MTWVPVQQFDTSAMCSAAKRRNLVRLSDGLIAKLVRWPGDVNRRLHQGNRARVQRASGAVITVPVAKVADLWME